MDNCFVLFLLVVAAVAVAVYTVVVHNRLSNLRLKLIALAASIRARRQHRQQVGADLNGHVGRAQGHERSVVRFGARRGGRGKALIRDVGNGWATVTATAASTAAMSEHVSARQAELSLREELHAAAETYNKARAAFPASVVVACSSPAFFRHGRSKLVVLQGVPPCGLG